MSKDKILVKMERSILHQKQNADNFVHIIKKVVLENITLTRLNEVKNDRSKHRKTCLTNL